jgi:hypothetical protein
VSFMRLLFASVVNGRASPGKPFGVLQDEPHYIVNDAFSVTLRISLNEQTCTTSALASHRGQN